MGVVVRCTNFICGESEAGWAERRRRCVPDCPAGKSETDSCPGLPAPILATYLGNSFQPMARIVQKYGGTSVGGIERIKSEFFPFYTAIKDDYKNWR